MPFLAALPVWIGALIQIAFSVLSAVLQNVIKSQASKPNKQSLKGRRSELQNTVRDSIRPREIVLGRMVKGGTFLFLETVNNETVLLMDIAFAGHQVKAIDEIYFFNELAISQAGVVQPKFAGLVEFEKFLGTATQNASSLLLANSTTYAATERNRGIAHVAFKIAFGRDVFNQIPNVRASIRGAEIFDSRDSVTRYTNNAALAFAYYLNHLTYGLGAAYGTDINSVLLNAAANTCDEDVAIKAGKTLQFDGFDDEINFGDVLDQTGALTVEARIYPDVVNVAGMKVLDKDNGSQGWSLQVQNDRVRFITRGITNVVMDTGAGSLAAGAWKRVAGRWNSATGRKSIFIDGIEVAFATGNTGSLAANATALKAGLLFKGRLQDLRIWSVARSDSEVAQYDDKTLTGTETNLVGYWKLDEKRGTRAEDATETPNDGTISGAIWIDDTAVIGSEKRYAANGVIFSDAKPGDIIEDLLTSFAGSFVNSGGEWMIRAGAYDTPTIAFNESHARAPMRVQARRSRRELFNAVRGTFLAPENDFQPADFPLITNAAFETEDGGFRITQDIELPFTTSPSMAQRLGWLHLLRNREQVACQYNTNLYGLTVGAGHIIDLTNTRMGWSNKDFEVVGWQFVQVESEGENEAPALGIDLDLREISAAIFNFNPATDEVPLNPSPDTLLPSPFGQIAMVSSFIERSGFTEIKHQEGAFQWPGTVVGFVFNPLTGDLNVEDQVAAVGNNFNVFDQYVQTPRVSAYYESPEMDIDFDDTVRTYVEFNAVKGVNETGSFKFAHKYDIKPNAGVYGGWKDLLSSAKAEGRFFKHRIEFDFSDETGGILKGFNAVIDKTTVFQNFSDQVVPVGGKSYIFDQRYHLIPALGYGVKNAGARTVSFPAISTTGFDAIVFSAGSDVGGTISVVAQGV